MPPSSWITIEPDSHFSIANIPFGIISTADDPTPRPATRIGDTVLDLSAFARFGGFASCPAISKDQLQSVFTSSTLNDFAALGRPTHRAVRSYLKEVFKLNTAYSTMLKDAYLSIKAECLIDADKVTMQLPMHIGDYTDFYAGGHHAYNVGVLFRGPENALQENYTHLPVGYHGRASSIVVSGTPIRRPHGQILDDPRSKDRRPILAATGKLDFELELGCFICVPNELGVPIDVQQANEHIFGYVLLNDWSARDIQAWEYVPLGPFNGKNFATSISPWVVLADAVEGARCAGPRRRDLGSSRVSKKSQGADPSLFPYLRQDPAWIGINIDLEVAIRPNTMPSRSGIENDVSQSEDEDRGRTLETIVTRTNARSLMYSFEQMIAHHSIGGCNLQTGDLLGSGTISGTSSALSSSDSSVAGTPSAYGSLLELTQNGRVTINLSDHVGRGFLEDGDEVIFRGVLRGNIDEGLIGFGECRGIILPAHAQRYE